MSANMLISFLIVCVVAQCAQIDMSLQVVILELVGLICAHHLLFKALDMRRQQPKQANRASFVLCERGAFGQPLAVQEIHAMRGTSGEPDGFGGCGVVILMFLTSSLLQWTSAKCHQSPDRAICNIYLRAGRHSRDVEGGYFCCRTKTSRAGMTRHLPCSPHWCRTSNGA